MNKKEKDRLAILSLQGEYKVGFEFTELYGAETNYKLESLLFHIMAMYIKNKNGVFLNIDAFIFCFYLFTLFKSSLYIFTAFSSCSRLSVSKSFA